MDKQTVLNLLTKPGGNDTLFSDIVCIYLKKIRISPNNAYVMDMAIPRPSKVEGEDIDQIVSIQRRIYTEVLEVLVDKFNQHTDVKIPTTGTHVADFIDTLTVFLNIFYDMHQGTNPKIVGKMPVFSLEINYLEKEAEIKRGAHVFKCTAEIDTDGVLSDTRQLTINFFM